MFKKRYYLNRPKRKSFKACLFQMLWSTIGLLFVNFFILWAIRQKAVRSFILGNNEKLVDVGENYVNDFFSRRKNLNLSQLGRILFQNAKYPDARNDRFKILVWNDGPFLERRHINFFQTTKNNPFANCSVNNCDITYNSEDLREADAVLFLLLRQHGDTALPTSSRTPHQRWIFLTDENPYNTFLFKPENNWGSYEGIFNWSMTYRMKSDIPVPNGRVVPFATAIPKNVTLESFVLSTIPNIEVKQRKVLVAAFLTDCSPTNPLRSQLKALQDLIDVDIYGKCGNTKTKCPSYFGADCPQLNNYLFYISVESHNCKEYLSQRLFWNSFAKGAVPIILETSKEDCLKILPPKSYLHSFDFESAHQLADHISMLNETWLEYLKMHQWRTRLYVSNEHGYFGTRSYHYCRICEALNYNDQEPKVYDDLSGFLSTEKNCLY